MSLVLTKLKENTLKAAYEEIINCVKDLIAYNPTYDLKYLYKVTKSTIGILAWNKYGIAFAGSWMFITRMSDFEYIAEITENNHKII